MPSCSGGMKAGQFTSTPATPTPNQWLTSGEKTVIACVAVPVTRLLGIKVTPRGSNEGIVHFRSRIGRVLGGYLAVALVATSGRLVSLRIG